MNIKSLMLSALEIKAVVNACVLFFYLNRRMESRGFEKMMKMTDYEKMMKSCRWIKTLHPHNSTW